MSERSREAYRGTSLIARTYRTTVRGKAWCNGREIASIEGLTEPDVLETLRHLVDDAVTVETAPNAVPYPSAEAYEDALQAILRNLTDKHRRMLRAHCRARGRTLALEALAEAGGYPTPRSAYQQYGNIGRMLGEAMLFEPRANPSGRPLWVLMLVEDGDAERADKGARWRMREQLSSSLKGHGVA